MGTDPEVAAGEDLPLSLRPSKGEALRPSLNPPPPPPLACWKPGQREAWRSLLPAAAWEEVAVALGLPDDTRRYVLEGTGSAATASAGIERPHGPRLQVWRSKAWLDLLLGLGPAAISRLFGLGGGSWRATPDALRGFVAVHELEAARIARSFPPSLLDDLLSALTPIADVRIAELAGRRLLQVGADSKIGAAALGWLLANTTHAAWALVELAQAEENGRAKAGRLGLQALLALGHRNAVDEAARAFGALPEELVVTRHTAELPRFVNLAQISAPVLVNGKRLPTEAVEAFLKILASHEPSAAEQLAQLDSAFTRESLERFALEVFGAASARPKSAPTELWPEVLGRYGSDAAVEQLSSKLKKDWAEEASLLRISCEVLRRIGAPRAIVELAHLVDKRHTHEDVDPPRDAAEALERLASSRGTTPRELIGDAVGKSGRGLTQARTLSFGPRAFRVELDAQLSPMLFDEEGSRIAQLPRPRKSDDEAAVSQSKQQLQQLRAQLALVAPLALTLLEEDLVEGRRWRRLQFEAWLETDPLFRHLARQLVWGWWSESGELLAPGLVDEGRLRPIIEGAAQSDRVGLLHPVDLVAEQLASLREATAARGLQPPFPQLDREVFRASPAERGAQTLERFAGARLRLRRPLLRGWRPGPIDEQTAYLNWIQRRFECGVTAELLHSGIDCGDVPDSSVKLKGLRFRGAAGLLELSEVPPRALSEACRDATVLASGR